MSQLKNIYAEAGAVLAPDGIPLHFGDQLNEYKAARDAAVLFDRSHEGRLALSEKDRFDLINRMSTNDTLNMSVGEGRATVFINPNGRIIDRVVGFSRSDDTFVLLCGPGRGAILQNYLQRNIFFNDDVQQTLLNAHTHQFALHGPRAGEIVGNFVPEASELAEMQSIDVDVDGVPVFIARRKAYVGSHFVFISSTTDAARLWQMLLGFGDGFNMRPSGGLVYNALRIRAGQPGTGRELSGDFIPLEVGLWDEISFNKGCYTGQEIIARMESRERVARTIVRIDADEPIPQGSDLYADGKKVGVVTSSVVTPLDERCGVAVVKVAAAEPGKILHVGSTDGQEVKISDLLGVQPPFIMAND